MLEKDTLGGAGRARGVHDTAEILGLGRNGVDGVLLALLGEFIEAEDGEVGVGVLELVNVVLLDILLAVVDDVLNVLGVVEGLDELCEEVRVEEDELCVCLLERVLEALFAEGVVSGDDGHGLGGSGC